MTQLNTQINAHSEDAISPIPATIAKPTIDALLATVATVVLDKPVQLKLALTCLLANGHLLLEDLPGMGKTTLATCLARVLGLQYQRVQFTSDLLPADILGFSMYEPQTQTFQYHAGAVFTQLLLADEINRSSPKTQSALLEAMEERQVSHEGVTRALPQPFFVIATQNPFQQSGTYPLPESQLDRFLMCLSLGYPSPAAEQQLLTSVDPRQRMQALQPMMTPATLLAWQKGVTAVGMTAPVVDYLQRLVQQSRELPAYEGLSTRGLMALKQAAQAYAYISGRDYVVPEDIQAIFPAVATHRIAVRVVKAHALTAAETILQRVPVLI